MDAPVSRSSMESMHNYLDIRTLLFVVSIIGLVICLSFAYALATRRTYAGFSAWTISSFAGFLGLLLVSFRGVVPDVISIIAGGALIVSAVVFVAYGLELFFGMPARVRQYGLLMILTVFGLLCFTYISPSVNARIMIVSGSIVVINLWCAFLVWKGVPKLLGVANRFLTAAFMMAAVLNAIRFALAAFFDPAIPDLMAASRLHAVSLLLMIGVHIFVMLGLLLLNFLRVEQDLKGSLDEIRILRGIIPICSACKKVRDDQGAWKQIESYIRDHSEAQFSHGICPDCAHRLYPDYHDTKNNDF